MAIAAPGAAAAATDSTPSITVVGHASTTAPNDTARVRLGVVTRAKTAATALNRNSARAQNVVNAVRSQGIPAADIRTETVSLDRVTLKRRHHKPRVLYRAANRVVVTVRDIDRTPIVIDVAVAAGATEVSGVTFSTSKKDQLYRTALGAAFDDAKAKATLLAERAGVAVGTPLQITEGVQASDNTYAAPSAGRNSVAVPIQPGIATVRAEVTVTFAIG